VHRRLLVASALAAAALTAACGGQDQDPEGARALWTKIHTGSGFRSWARAPGYASRQPSFTAHARQVEVFVSPEVASTLAGPSSATSWPVGSIIVKEGFDSSGDRSIVAVMEKRPSGWYWAEYDDDGGSLFSGTPPVCLDCHGARKSYSDWVYTFELPR